jgi:predicted PurR-regulated permease PerM
MVARQDTTGVLLMVVFGWLIPTVIDKVVRTRIARRFGQIHPLVTLIGAIIGVRLFGMIGIIAGPLTIMTFFELLRAYERDYGAAGAGDVGADAVNVPATGLAPEQRLSHSESAP